MKSLRDAIIPTTEEIEDERDESYLLSDISIMRNATIKKINKLEQSAIKVYGFYRDKDLIGLSYKQDKDDTHTGYIIAIEPIAKPVTKEEIIQGLRSDTIDKRTELADRIASHGIAQSNGEG
jgi:hypothetical protein